MKALISAVVAACALPSLALAQTAAPPPADPAPAADPVFEPAPAPEPEPAPAPEPAPVESPKLAAGGEDDGVNRPSAFSVGFGFGYDFPADLQIPDTTSVRFRLPSGLILEPALEVSRSSESMEVGGIDVTNDTTVLALAALARFPVLSSASMDLVGIGGASAAFSKIDPDGGNNDTDVTALALVYGIGLDLWIHKRWALSFTTLNPVVTYTNTSTDDPAGGDTSDSDTTIGLIFNPDVLVMVHLFFD